MDVAATADKAMAREVDAPEPDATESPLFAWDSDEERADYLGLWWSGS